MLPPIHLQEEYSELSPKEIIIETIKASVFDWIEKYHPREESNLIVDNPEDKNELIRWRD
jgi:hypothetical protein